MHIISGKFRGQKLNVPKAHIRPTMDSVREAIFSMIRHRLDNAVVLDLFAGSGSLGIEALSEEAKICHFVDNSFKAIRCIEANINKLHINKNVKVSQSSALSFINRCESNYYDMIFIDPPYKSKIVAKIVDVIFEKDILKFDGLVVAECSKDEDLSKIKDKIIKSKIYGDTMISLISRGINE
ncbi:MAG: 16S rRNA (guanine(966)-N(2))-methyltransferase RsmD [Candidatus Cloacimonetes bacterium]|nr:16S rRNA (guanine(966)-N(2))-methyltransferase RsmD [Candidatus Cloacimonadota bacterium]